MTKANYDDAVRTIKNAILKSQYRAAKGVNQGALSNNFMQALPAAGQALRAIGAFKG